MRDQVRLLKEEMRDRFGASHALKSPAHITLQMPFRREEGDESSIVEKLKSFAAKESSFKVELSGYDCFEPRVLFIKIVDHKSLISFQSRLKRMLHEELGFKVIKPEFNFHPHMTIATRDLSEESFYKIWPEFELREFEASFEVRSLFLLKHNGNCWDVYREFYFGS